MPTGLMIRSLREKCDELQHVNHIISSCFIADRSYDRANVLQFPHGVVQLLYIRDANYAK